LAEGDQGEGATEAHTASQLARERRRAESAEQRLRAQTLLFAEAEHKLKTSLSVISGWAATLDENWERMDEGLRRQGVSAIRRAADELNDQARTLLEDARAEIANLDLEPVPLNLVEVLAATTTMYEGVSRDHDVRFEAVEGTAWALVDPAGLQQILGHLIENAVKYSPGGGPITLRVSSQGGSVVIDVVDEGVGLPHGVDVFAAFQRGPDPETTGVGLGLYIVRNLVEGMGGKVTARSNDDGPGSTFSVVLPGLD
jgi:NtrC-family two-component system sensor histidine kinase KinB